MCGLTGFVDPRVLAPAQAARLVENMAERLAHRGPDGSGVWTEGAVALGHRRLSILELGPAGDQPMLSSCERFVLVFNGEIYNHLELRGELARAGATHNWRGRSDTETLLAAIVHWGLEATLKRCYGMFALALWDRREGTLQLARDRMGEKPLYWGWAGKAFLFGSELKALTAHPDFDRTTCRGAVAQYLRFGYVPAPRSIYKTIFKLEPGTLLTLRGDPPALVPEAPLRPGEQHGTIGIRHYWSLAEALESGGNNRIDNEAEALEALEETLMRAVKRQMISDVPLGAFLSGGIDSSTIVALMQAQSTRPVRTFTVGFEETAFNEAPFAAEVARHLGTDHSELRVTSEDARATIPDLPTMYDEPFGDSSQVPTHLICRAARARATVALSGDGGDELFGGYNRYFWGPRVWRQLSWMPFKVRRALGAGIGALPQAFWTGAEWSSRRLGGPRLTQIGETIAICLRDIRHSDDIYRSVVSHWHQPEDLVLDEYREPPSAIDAAIPAFNGADCVGTAMMVQDMRIYLPGDILCKLDRAAMHIGLETRAPFLDNDVLALAPRLPSSMRFRDNKGKWALRQVLYQYVPRELIERPKTGFSIPVGTWLRGPLREWAEDLLSVDSLKANGLLDPVPVRQAWEQHLAGRFNWSNRLWTVLMLQAWQEHQPAQPMELQAA